MSSLETSVTLDDVFAVVEAKRVPLAPELAGYLTLEVADGADAGGGDVDPKTVYISEEGTVALVRPKKDAPQGEAESSVRTILAKLLDASGSATPALTAAAKRKPGTGLPSLVEELEAALIPVNRAAGRRALARLAREVKRVTMGVGRNASAGPISSQMKPAAGPAKDAPRPNAPRPLAPKAPGSAPKVAPSAPKMAAAIPKASPSAPRTGGPGRPAPLAPRVGPTLKKTFDEENATAKRENPLEAMKPEEDPMDDLEGKTLDYRASKAAKAKVLGLTPPPLPGVPSIDAPAPAPVSSPAPPASLPLSPAPAAVRPVPPSRTSGPLSPVLKPGSIPPPTPPPPKPRSATGTAPVAEVRPEGGGEKLFGFDEVDDLLSSFEVSGGSEKETRDELKAIAGVAPTPGPPDANTLASLTKDIGKDLPKRISGGGGPDDSVDALLALADASHEPPLAKPRDPSEADIDIEVAAPPPAAVALGRPLGRVGQEPGAPKLPEVRDLGPSSAPPPPNVDRISPLVPSAAMPGIPPPPAVPPMMAAVASSFDTGELNRPVTPSQLAPPRPPRDFANESQSRRPAPDPSSSSRSSRKVEPAATTSGRSRKATRTGNTGTYRQPRAPRTGLAMLLLTLLVLVAGGVAIYMWKPTFFTGRKKPVPVATQSVSATPPAPPRCKVALVVTDVPANAEILLRMGQSPLDVERMPVGTRLEFVATAEGYAPKRAIVKAESTWDKGSDGKPRVDVPIQLDPSKAKAGAVDPWPAAEPGSQVGGSGSPGTVHVVANVRGAEVWLLAGLGPEARIEQLKCDADIDVLLAGPPALRKRLHVSEKDIAAATADPQGNKVVSITAK